MKKFLAICSILAMASTAHGAAFVFSSDGWHAPAKVAAASLDYSIDWTLWLGADTIALSSWVYSLGITGGAESIDGPKKITTTWLSGGTAGQTYTITNTITTTAGRIQVQRFSIAIK